MRHLLIAINLLLIVAIVGVIFYWNPQPDEMPLAGTHAAKLGRDVPATPPAGAANPAMAVSVIDPYIPLVPPGIKVGAAYFELKNEGKQDVRLIGASCPAAGATELHDHIDDNGVMRMRRVKEIVVPARGGTTFKPGGYHVMLIDLKATLKEGDQLAITLHFADGDKTIAARVR